MITANPVVKRYFITDQLVNNFPTAFVNSPNTRYVHVVNCHLYIDEPEIDDEYEGIITPRYISLHADFIHDDRYLDSFVMFVNEPIYKRKKYQQFAQQNRFTIKFKDKDGKELDMSKVKFVLELLLEY